MFPTPLPGKAAIQGALITNLSAVPAITARHSHILQHLRARVIAIHRKIG
jgi:hypothetical protein